MVFFSITELFLPGSDQASRRRPTDGGSRYTSRGEGRWRSGSRRGPADMLAHSTSSGPAYIDAYRDSVVDALSVVADAVHEAGSPVIGQLTHTGGYETGDWEMQEQLAPSPSISDAAYEIPKGMDTDDIAEVRNGFATAAENLEAAGFNGVELAANPFSLLRQFLSPRFNNRDDEYGGDLSGRARLANETIDAVADVIDGPVGLHLSLVELVYGGYEFSDAPDTVDVLSGFDYLSCTAGTRSTFNQTHAGAANREPPLVESIESVASIVDLPVMGRAPFTSVDDVTRILDAGRTSFASRGSCLPTQEPSLLWKTTTRLTGVSSIIRSASPVSTVTPRRERRVCHQPAYRL
jgi:2,4-dienoyl-CoA reductase-like NADH-dependent reductase (Old Yellow Enzyme family)